LKKVTDRPLELDLLPQEFSIARLPPDARIPGWAIEGSWYSLTRTGDECSVVCESVLVPEGVRQTGPWGAFKVRGPLDFGLTGILRRLADPLADSGISIFAVSTYDTDYVLVRGADVERAADSLRQVGIVVHVPAKGHHRP
jgi:hypothetical protein